MLQGPRAQSPPKRVATCNPRGNTKIWGIPLSQLSPPRTSLWLRLLIETALTPHKLMWADVVNTKDDIRSGMSHPMVAHHVGGNVCEVLFPSTQVDLRNRLMISQPMLQEIVQTSELPKHTREAWHCWHSSKATFITVPKKKSQVQETLRKWLALAGKTEWRQLPKLLP